MGFHLPASLLGKYPDVNTFADLPAPSDHTGEVYLVKTATGIIFVNRKRAGLYLSDGSSWTKLGKIILAGAGSPTPGYLPSNPPSGKYVVTNVYLDLEAKEQVIEYYPTPKE